ncbi:Hsp70 protein Hsp70D [Volvox carteri f. nagariensis]|uniref:Hsp70 protein Hsp70D n=1 Tax=Volvox carteri f. nagariensis TaxID=3068 RepID=D8TWN6_VOLCA|nr:Hsp70 protein Hsp70D [Volvox carteri f. nagariensis]EFJ48180.1 Hsp70 protein Hsp70D [Volvox carteri f. nagariensis]|eukprot:XP_002950865.1 Hsp70 protein Hsp70D [Volvox carteri f. nagariensis]
MQRHICSVHQHSINSDGRLSCPRYLPRQSGRRGLLAVHAKLRDFQREVVVGIDLGTTNSAVAYIEGGKPKCIPNADGETITPSVVGVLKDGEVVVGRRAQRQAVLHPQTTYYSVKRLIGRQYDDPAVQEEITRLPYKVSRDEEGALVVECPSVGPGYLYPEEISAQVVSQLVSDAAAYTRGKVTKAVIAVPAYFDERQREATISAGKLAGLETVRLLREPVAAALAYGLDLRTDSVVLVFDLGGGTYDVSLLEVGNGTVEVLSTGGDAYLGGDDWDEAIVSWLERTHLRPAGLDPSSDPRLRANLRALAQTAKHSLSDNDEVVLRMPVGGPGGGPLEVRLSRTQLDELTQDLWRRCRLPLDQACWQAGVDLNEVLGGHEALKEQLRNRGVPSWKLQAMQPEIRPRKRAPLSSVLLVGGATRMAAVGRFLSNMTGLQPLQAALDPDEAVALGAAVQAGILQGEISNLMVMDQWQASLMRALAKLQLQADPRVRQRMERQYSLEDEGESAVDEYDEDDVYGRGGGGNEEGVTRPVCGSSSAGRRTGGVRAQLSKRQRRRLQQQQKQQPRLLLPEEGGGQEVGEEG